MSKNVLGKCCICEKSKNVNNVIMLHFKAPPAPEGEEAGWGCVVCGLPVEGAVAVVCDDCFTDLHYGVKKIKFVCVGWPIHNKRLPIDQVEKIPFDHDPQKHLDEILVWGDHP